VRLEGTLDAFSLPDIFQLLSYTKKTGTLHLRREGLHGVVHVRDGAVTGGRGDAARQALGRRLVGAGLVDDDTLAAAAEHVLDNPGAGLGKALVATGNVDADTARELAAEQASDAVFELLRWPNGEFAFVVDEEDPDEVGASLPVEDVVAEANRRLTAWQDLADRVPSLDAVVSIVPSPSAEPAFSREEWTLLALVDGTRSVSDLVALAGTGEYVVVSCLASLAERGLVTVGAPTQTDPHAQRQQLLSALEGKPVAAPEAPSTPAPSAAEPPAPAPAAPAPAAPEQRTPVIPERPEPFTPSRRPDHAEPAPTFARYAASAQAGSSSSVGAVQGAHALAAEAAPASFIDRDPSVNKSLLLRLIAGVRGL
jgi:hypothetical protein